MPYQDSQMNQTYSIEIMSHPSISKIVASQNDVPTNQQTKTMVESIGLNNKNTCPSRSAILIAYWLKGEMYIRVATKLEKANSLTFHRLFPDRMPFFPDFLGKRYLT